jgi:Na+-transporting methylmalonyl-CoA/oxaloacetate decarboxylase gamma subunit
MNLQHKKHSLAKSVFKYAAFGSILIMALWGMSAEASPSEYEPPPPKTTAQTLMEIGDSCLNREIMVLSVINSEGKRVYLTFLCKFQFASEIPPGE